MNVFTCKLIIAECKEMLILILAYSNVTIRKTDDSHKKLCFPLFLITRQYDFLSMAHDATNWLANDKRARKIYIKKFKVDTQFIWNVLFIIYSQ